MSKVLLLILLLLSFFLPSTIFAKNNNYISIVNPIRGKDFWDIKNQQPQDVVSGEAQILKKFNLPATWLIRFDALEEKEILQEIPKQDEKGLFLEVTPSWVNDANVNYHESAIWHAAGSAFLTGYEVSEREKLIDKAFEKFKSIYALYPKSVGAWWVDSYSISYMEKKYGISAVLIVADQYTTDNYQIWGQYFSTPYYPAKNNALHPASSPENKLSVVMMQWAARDPVNSYGNGVSESTYSLQANDYIDYHNLDINYFKKLIELYQQPLNKFSHLVVGLENSYFWQKYQQEYQNQINTLFEMKNSGALSVITMEDFSSWYRNEFPLLSPEQIIVSDDPLGTFKKSVWFMNPYYRAGWFLNQDGSVFRDIHQYIEGEEELCFKKRCDSVNFATSAIRALDEVSFGHKWIIDEGKVSDFKVSKDGEKYQIFYENEIGKNRTIDFLPRDIGIDGKISSIDTFILEAVKNDSNQIKNISSLEKGSFKWTFVGFLSSLTKFIIFLGFSCIIPGLVITRKRSNVYISTIIGLVCLTLVFYISSLLKLKIFIPLYILFNLFLFFYLQLYKFRVPKFANKFNFLLGGIILAGTIFQILPTFKSGLVYPYGMGLWGPNTHDGLWHIALINQLIKDVPAQNPILSSTILRNYHYFYDLLIAVTNFITGISIIDLVFRFYPILFSLMLGLGTYRLSTVLFKNKIAAIFSLYFVYFAGSFGWIVEYIKFKHLGGESAFWANQSISFNLNPPFAISLLIVIAFLLLLYNFRKDKNTILQLGILAGIVIAFKSYAGVLIITTLLLIGCLKRSADYLYVFFISLTLAAFLFLSSFSLGSSLIILSPFWFIHSMIDSPDRVGWFRLSLMRNTGTETGNWFKFFTSEIISLTLFILGNLGTRMIALLSISKINYIVRQENYLFIFLISVLSFIIPILFIQAGNPWNTIQFLYYGLYFSAVIAGVVVTKILSVIKKSVAIPLILVILIITPINSWATANSYLNYQPHAKISQEELEALTFLAKQPLGNVLTFPYDEKLKRKITEPWPILVYDDTAYVSALSGKAVYFADQSQNQILLTDYQKRLIATKDFFLNLTTDFMKKNNLKYIYLPKIYQIAFDETKASTKKIFENEDVNIYIIN